MSDKALIIGFVVVVFIIGLIAFCCKLKFILLNLRFVSFAVIHMWTIIFLQVIQEDDLKTAKAKTKMSEVS